MTDPAVGSIVHVRLLDETDVCRAAVIVAISGDREYGTVVDLHVFPSRASRWEASIVERIPQAADHVSGTAWHWPES